MSADSQAVRVEARAHAYDGSVLYGRDRERRAVSARLDAARSGTSSAIVVLGGPGMGKSSLLDDLREGASDMRILSARGIQSESELPFAALHQLLRPLLGSLEQLPREQAGALRGALGLGAGTESDAYRVALAALTMLAEASDDTPVLCIVDDLHWIDASSAQVLLFVARRLHAERLLMIFAAREDELPPVGFEELHLGPLDAAAASYILADRSGATVADDVAARVTAATGGNPLAIAELAALLTRDQLSGRDPCPSPLPLSAGVERLFAERVNALPEDTRKLLLVAAADDTGMADIVIAAGRTVGATTTALTAAEHDGLVRVEGAELRFHHPLVRSAIYGTATLGERHAAHRALADVMRERGEIDRFAWHLAAATVEPDEAVVAELEQAAARARGREAYAAAAAAMERAAKLTESAPERGRRLTDAAADAWRAGLFSQAARLVEAAELLVDDVVLLANCYRLRGAIELAVGTSATAVPVLINAARRTAEIDPRRALELLALASEGASLTDDPAAAATIAELAGELDVGDEERDRFFAALLVGFGHKSAGNADAANAAIRAAIVAAANEVEDVDLLLAAGRAGFYIGDDEAAVRFHRRIVSRARTIGSIGCLAIAGSRLAFAELLTGQWVAGVATAQETEKLAEDTGQTELVAHAHAWLGLAAAWRGDDEAARTHVQASRTITESHPMALVQDVGHWIMGTIELAAGRAGAAYGHLRGITHPVIRTASALDRIEAAVRAQRRGEAEASLAELESFAAGSDSPWARAHVAHCQGLLAADAETAVDAYETALEEHTRAGRPFDLARTQLDYGSLLRRQRRRVDAREHLRAAFEAFENLGAARWTERAQAELRATGETARRRDPAESGKLTSQELHVARFVAQGLSNREVAAQLFLSPRTVDFHLRNVFMKLGLTSRVELAARELDSLFAAPTVV